MYSIKHIPVTAPQHSGSSIFADHQLLYTPHLGGPATTICHKEGLTSREECQRAMKDHSFQQCDRQFAVA